MVKDINLQLRTGGGIVSVHVNDNKQMLVNFKLDMGPTVVMESEI